VNEPIPRNFVYENTVKMMDLSSHQILPLPNQDSSETGTKSNFLSKHASQQKYEPEKIRKARAQLRMDQRDIEKSGKCIFTILIKSTL
jgi:hypothetical protein